MTTDSSNGFQCFLIELIQATICSHLSFEEVAIKLD